VRLKIATVLAELRVGHEQIRLNLIDRIGQLLKKVRRQEISLIVRIVGRLLPAPARRIKELVLRPSATALASISTMIASFTGTCTYSKGEGSAGRAERGDGNRNVCGDRRTTAQNILPCVTCLTWEPDFRASATGSASNGLSAPRAADAQAEDGRIVCLEGWEQ
jgi:hypothetical protein